MSDFPIPSGMSVSQAHAFVTEHGTPEGLEGVPKVRLTMIIRDLSVGNTLYVPPHCAHPFTHHRMHRDRHRMHEADLLFGWRGGRFDN